jgi:hypothetical protein
MDAILATNVANRRARFQLTIEVNINILISNQFYELIKTV